MMLFLKYRWGMFKTWTLTVLIYLLWQSKIIQWYFAIKTNTEGDKERNIKGLKANFHEDVPWNSYSVRIWLGKIRTRIV